MAMPVAIACSSKNDTVGVVRRRRRRVDLGWRAAEEHHRAGHALEHVAEVLGAHDRVGQLDHVLRAGDELGE